MNEKVGVKFNKSFESVGTTPDKKYLFSGNEGPILQDKSKAYGAQEYTRLLRLEYDSSLIREASATRSASKTYQSYKIDNEFVYPLDKLPDNGVVDITPLNKDEIFVLERSYDAHARKVSVRLYYVLLKDAPSSLNVESLNKLTLSLSVKKYLVIDFDDLLEEMPAGFQIIDNIEGLVFGPNIEEGKKSLFAVSDNNFRSTQLTQLLWLKFDIERFLEDMRDHQIEPADTKERYRYSK